MVAISRVSVFLFLVTIFVSHGALVTTTPVAKVISLLGKLEAQIEKEGKKEAAEYDKFACYCKDEADNTNYAIETSTEKISVLDAAIEKLDADIKELESDISDLTATIKKKESDIKTAVNTRADENTAYNKLAEEIADAIGAIEGAIKSLKDSKTDMKNTKLNLLQDHLLDAFASTGVSPSPEQLRAVEAFAQTPADPAKKHAYVYRSNDIIGTLETLLKQFKQKKKDTNVAEKEKLFAFEEKKQSLENEKDFANTDKTEAETTLSDKNEDRADKKKDRNAEDKAMKADQAYLKELTADCGEKAKQFDQRSSVRSSELTAISKAMEQLQGGISENYGSNSLAAGASFLQLRRGSGSAETVIARAASLVDEGPSRLHSADLSGLVLKMRLSRGHFKKVIDLIKNLVKKLEKEAKAMADSKDFCDKEMQKTVDKRDKNKLEMESQDATIAMKNAEKVKLTEEVASLGKEIAGLAKSLLEASELRQEEKADNEATLESAKSGKEAIDYAIKVLDNFYKDAALLQSPKGKNRDGKTIADTRPKLSYSGDYKGKQDAAKGIIGLLDVIAGDFEKTIASTTSDEAESAADFKAFEKDNKADSEGKAKLKGEKEDAIKKARQAITKAKDDMNSADKLMTTAIAELEKVTAMCLTGEGTFAERKKQREEEIQTLKGAMKVLENWKAF